MLSHSSFTTATFPQQLLQGNTLLLGLPLISLIVIIAVIIVVVVVVVVVAITTTTTTTIAAVITTTTTTTTRPTATPTEAATKAT